MGKRMRAKLLEIRQELQKRMHDPIPTTGKWLKSVVQGYFNYHAIPLNGKRLAAFRDGVIRHWRHVLSRRSQRGGITWERMVELVRRPVVLSAILCKWRYSRLFSASQPLASLP